MTDSAAPTEFSEHSIRSKIETDDFSTWLMQRGRPGQWSSTFWVRITAAEGMLRVSGDFTPVVFAYGPRPPGDCLRWMAGRMEPDSYAMEKASIGTGRDSVYCWDEQLARQDMRDVGAEEEPDSPYAEAIDAALSGSDQYSGRFGCLDLIRTAVEAADELGATDIHELIGDAGRRPAPHVGLALRACTRLVEILDGFTVALQLRAKEVEADNAKLREANNTWANVATEQAGEHVMDRLWRADMLLRRVRDFDCADGPCPFCGASADDSHAPDCLHDGISRHLGGRPEGE
jgi:hypothetical protein